MAKGTTKIEAEERVALATRLKAAGMRDGQIKRVMAQRFGCSPRSVERYITAARRDLIARRNRTKEEAQADSLAFYESVLQDSQASELAKLRAQENIDKLLGLREPQRFEHTGADGGPMEHAFPDAHIEPDHDAWDREVESDASLNGHSNGSSNGASNGRHH